MATIKVRKQANGITRHTAIVRLRSEGKALRYAETSPNTSTVCGDGEDRSGRQQVLERSIRTPDPISLADSRHNIGYGGSTKIPLLPLLGFVLLACSQDTVAQDLTCHLIDGVEQVIRSTGVFIGEMHGSAESPAFLSALACHAMKSNHPLVVAMEYDARDQSTIDQFMHMLDERKAVASLTATPHWTGNCDGRASAAMRDALLEMRHLAKAGHQVKLIAYDFGGASPADRDRKCAELIRRVHSDGYGAAYWIVFGGNVHARKTKGLPFLGAPAGSGDYEPLGYLIRDWGLIHLDAAYRGGSIWACTGPSPDDCASKELGPGCTADCPAHPIVRLQAVHRSYDGIYDVGKLTVSGPLHLQH